MFQMFDDKFIVRASIKVNITSMKIKYETNSFELKREMITILKHQVQLGLTAIGIQVTLNCLSALTKSRDSNCSLHHSEPVHSSDSSPGSSTGSLVISLASLV